jgi:hypothetical protein
MIYFQQTGELDQFHRGGPSQVSVADRETLMLSHYLHGKRMLQHIDNSVYGKAYDGLQNSTDL